MADAHETPATVVDEDDDGQVLIIWDAVAELPPSFVNVASVQYHPDQQTFYLALGAVPLPPGGISKEMMEKGLPVQPVAHLVMVPSVLQLFARQLRESHGRSVRLVEELKSGDAS